MSRRIAELVLLSALTTSVLGGCSVVGSSSTFDDITTPGGCRSTLGSYSLPKTVVRIQITKNPAQPYHVLQQFTPDRVPDNQHTFCLDHLRLPTASDEVRVYKNKITATETYTGVNKNSGAVEAGKRRVSDIAQDSTPFLQLIASKAVDHTAGIIRRLIRTAFILLTNKGSFSPARSSIGGAFTDKGSDIVVADFQVDPFDYREMAKTNEAVRKFGFCFVLEDYTFDSSRGGVRPDRYCRAPGKTASANPPRAAQAIEKLHYLVTKPTEGVFFRPRTSYRFSVYTNDDPDGRGAWRLGQLKNIDMENIMPIVSVGIGRAVFATRRTGLVFDDGALTNVCISKGSEIEGGIQIPLEVIYGVVALPSEMILGAINDAKTAKDLLTARNNLIAAQNQYVKFLNKDVGADALPTATSDATKKGTLKLGSTADSTATFVNDDPPDAGAIFSQQDGDALTDICAELTLAKTTNLGPNGAATGGNF